MLSGRLICFVHRAMLEVNNMTHIQFRPDHMGVDECSEEETRREQPD